MAGSCDHKKKFMMPFWSSLEVNEQLTVTMTPLVPGGTTPLTSTVNPVEAVALPVVGT